jgi:hypothetical protein
MLDLRHVVAVGRLVELELRLVLRELLLGALQFKGEFRGRLAFADL